MIVKNVEKKEKNSVTFQVEVSSDEFAEAISKAYLKNRKNISVPGFRKGKAPRMVIEGMYGANVFYDDAIEEVTPDAFQFAVESEKLETVGRPSCTDANVDDDKALLLSFETALYPEVTLGQYKGLEVPKEEINITDEDVDKYLEEMQKRNGRQITAERPAKLGDTADINYEGSVDGVPFEGGKADGHKLELGSGQFIPGFEEQVVGMSAGEERDITVTFPEEYHSDELAGKPAVFKVKVNEVVETELPAIDDEFAKDVSESDTLEDYKKTIREELLRSRTKAVEDDFGYAAVEIAVNNMTCEVPEAMILERMDGMVQEYDRNLMAQGMRLEEYIRMMGMDPSTFSNMIRPQAEAQVKTELLFTAVVKAEDVQVSDEELDKAIADLAAAYNLELEQIKTALPRDSMLVDMKKKKANDLIIETAVAVDPKPVEEAPKKKAPAKKAAAKADDGEKAPAKKAAPKAADGEKAPAKKAAPKAADGEKAPAKKTTKAKKTDEDEKVEK